MKAFILNEAGKAENLQLVEIEIPTIKDNEVLVKTKSISINPIDVKARGNDGVLTWVFGEIRPVVLGWDISGTIVEVGKNVVDFTIGDEVFGMVNFIGNGQAYAEFVAVPDAHLAKKPMNVSHEEAAAATLAAVTAYQNIVELGKVKNGNRVLIHAAAGGVGHFAVQIAKSIGAYVIGTSSAKNRDFILSLGADEHLDYTKDNFWERLENIDFVLDTIGGENLEKSVTVTNENGTIITLPSPEFSEIIQEKAKEKNIRLDFQLVVSKKETIQSIAELLRNGQLKSTIYKVFSFEDLISAHKEVETNHVVGKVIVNI